MDVDGVSVQADAGTELETLLRLLPPEWEARAVELGALQRLRKFPNQRVLLQVLLIHLFEGCSLAETAVHARLGGLPSVSAPALLKRLRAAGPWLQALAQGGAQPVVAARASGPAAGLPPAPD